MKALNITDAWGLVSPNLLLPNAPETVVAVIDTGIVYPIPPDLLGRVRFDKGYDFVTQNTLDASGHPNGDLSLDGDGPDLDPTDPGDRGESQTGNVNEADGVSTWHGTHITGIIAAQTDNGQGVAGIGTNNIKVLPLRALGHHGLGTLFDIAEAVYYAAKLPNIAECASTTQTINGVIQYVVDRTQCASPMNTGLQDRPMARVINLSLGVSSLSDEAARPLHDAIAAATNKGILVVVSAGNKASSSPFYPASDQNVIAVGAVNRNLSLSSYSNFGPNQFLVAPGGSVSEGILSTVDNRTVHSDPPGFGKLPGTSQAAAHVSAIAAMLFAELPVTTDTVQLKTQRDRVKEIFRTTATDLGSLGRDDNYGNGLVNPCGALLAINPTRTVPNATLKSSSESIDFGLLGTANTFVVTSGCSGSPIEGFSITKTSEGNGNWLDVSYSNNGSPVTVTLKVNRAGLAKATYHSQLAIHARTGDIVVKVQMTVSDGQVDGTYVDQLRREIEDLLSQPANGAGGSGDANGNGTGQRVQNTQEVGEMIVVLISTSDNKPKFYTKTDLSANYLFQFFAVTPGTYYLLAGVDENQDGKICVQGEREACFAYPNGGNPQTIEVTASTRNSNFFLSY